jgi:hypothetical protein
MIADTAQMNVDRLDGRTRHAKRLRSLIGGLARDLGHQPTTAERASIEQAAGLIVMREAMEQAVMRGEPVNSAEILKVSGAVARSLASLRSKGGKRNAPAPLSMRDRILRDRQPA